MQVSSGGRSSLPELGARTSSLLSPDAAVHPAAATPVSPTLSLEDPRDARRARIPSPRVVSSSAFSDSGSLVIPVQQELPSLSPRTQSQSPLLQPSQSQPQQANPPPSQTRTQTQTLPDAESHSNPPHAPPSPQLQQSLPKTPIVDEVERPGLFRSDTAHSGPDTRTRSEPHAKGRPRPVLKRFYSLPSNPAPSPARHHFRLPNPGPHLVKETQKVSLHEDPASGMSYVNQYHVLSEIGRGSYGMVFKAVDPSTGATYAIKACSKLRLAKLSRREIMRQRRRLVLSGAIGSKGSFSSDLIRREVAVMKKLDHPNLVTLYEVIDDPNSDSLYLVLEWCENGTIMPPERDYNGRATPLAEDQCRIYFRDLILAVEYLHARGVCHRDIKADNVMLGDDDVVKLADFGVSEIFDVTGDQTPGDKRDDVRQCVGSPAYMSPELVKLNRGGDTEDQRFTMDGINSVSGRKTDIWAMGVILFYMLHGRLPFEADNLAELFGKILHDDFEIATDKCCASLRDLMSRLLDKNPNTRISMTELRDHPWVTNNGTDKLLSREENVEDVGDLEDAITEDDLMSAIEMLELANDQHQTPLDIHDLAQSLRTEYGWRGSGSNRITRDNSRRPSPNRHSSTESVETVETVSHRNGKMDKLVRALDEIMRLQWWASNESAE